MSSEQRKNLLGVLPLEKGVKKSETHFLPQFQIIEELSHVGVFAAEKKAY